MLPALHPAYAPRVPRPPPPALCRAHAATLDRYGSVNYADPNFNVQLPVFAIHGNHDEPGGSGGESLAIVYACGGGRGVGWRGEE